MSKPIHPNLARIASIYDEVVLAQRGGRISETEAYSRIGNLVAKDDFGTEWSIDPHTGGWRYRDKWGDYYYAQPPEYGIVGAVPYDMQSGTTTYPRVSLYPVDEKIVETARDTLPSQPAARKTTKVYVFAGGVLIVSLLLVLYRVWAS